MSTPLSRRQMKNDGVKMAADTIYLDKVRTVPLKTWSQYEEQAKETKK